VESNRFQKWILVVAGVVLVVCVACGISMWVLARGTLQAHAGSQQTAQRLLMALRNHDWRAARQELTPEAQARFKPETLQQRWQLLEQAIGTVQDWTMEEFNLQIDTTGSWMDLRYRIQGGWGTGTARMRLREAGRQWRVETLEFGW